MQPPQIVQAPQVQLDVGKHLAKGTRLNFFSQSSVSFGSRCHKNFYQHLLFHVLLRM